ncbi:MAG: hypothetical protein M3Z29_04270 [Pseudomonadota bacterium]|nr:hypothetical protein [Pseudomonadota bacterium]
MDRLDIERLGGFGGFGGAHLKSTGRLAISALSAADRSAIERLFAHAPTAAAKPDEFSYRLTRQTACGPQTIQVAESHVPRAVCSSVRDELS